MRKVIRVRGDANPGRPWQEQDLIIMLGRQPRHRGRLVLGTPGISGRRVRPYETSILGFQSDGIGHSFTLNPTPNRSGGGWTAIHEVQSITEGEMNESGLITWDTANERRA